ncbi:MAG: N-acetylmuramoyl-L-alanine amidase [Hyphomicrobiaceae bacterium]|nr:N-acetylmuramoyl-L-alanine amidase [Hyphomicrobiaceae bacterium]
MSADLMLGNADSRHVDALHPSPNIEPRRDASASLLILHYTGMTDCAKAIDWLARPESKVSCHYVVDCDGTITQMVAERARAWHAGVSVWEGVVDINSRSIGIEIHNPGHEGGYPDFPQAQMAAVARLGLDIVTRNAIAPWHVLAHSDVAPARKIDPGEKFDWAWLAGEGVGLWVTPEPVGPLIGGVSRQPDANTMAHVQGLLAGYGYGIATTGAFDAQTRTVLRAFQRHFRPARVDGLADPSTIGTLERVVAARAGLAGS